ncbi:hypothetical protein ZOSMA_209G00130 [Zostera marina]|uniref:Uncharacterized protein n=1 Tax=Zostera marina TaxID=29655 RepID=A0A0K9PN92_ZOSMR|nr:hypothetical protein ZOSMA_209G00130 [Zostera marina]
MAECNPLNQLDVDRLKIRLDPCTHVGLTTTKFITLYKARFSSPLFALHYFMCTPFTFS